MLACECSSAECVNILCEFGMVLPEEVQSHWSPDVKSVMWKWMNQASRRLVLALRQSIAVFR
jgi:hypothetical protein